jgi:hypothetical protein
MSAWFSTPDSGAPHGKGTVIVSGKEAVSANHCLETPTPSESKAKSHGPFKFAQRGRSKSGRGCSGSGMGRATPGWAALGWAIAEVKAIDQKEKKNVIRRGIEFRKAVKWINATPRY